MAFQAAQLELGVAAVRDTHWFVYVVVEWKMAQRKTYKSTADVLRACDS